MANVEHSSVIDDLVVVRLAVNADDRGKFIETYRQEWFPGRPAMVQGNRSDSARGVVRALHYHLYQADYWYVPRGTILVGLHDLRRSSPTRGLTHSFEIGDEAPLGVYIPAGVAHGFQALTDATLTYLVDQYYDPADEHGVAWDDPEIAVPWPIPNPGLSPRDQANPKLADIPRDKLPE